MPNLLKPMEAAARLRDLACATADSAEKNRRLDKGFIQELRDSGLGGLAVPESIGGIGIDVVDLLGVMKTIAQGDGSAGWVTMIYATSSLTAHFLAPNALAEVFADGDRTLSAGVLAPRGTARRVEGGFVLSGRWPFASGSPDASWISLGATVDEAPDDGKTPPKILSFYLPMSEVEIVDTWDVIGLRATGSHDVKVSEKFVQAERAFDLSGVPKTTDPIVRFPIYGLLAAGIGAVSLGIARAAIDEAGEVGGVKVPTGSKRRLVDRPAFQEALARAESHVVAAESYLLLEAKGHRASGPDNTRFKPVKAEDRARLRMAATFAVESAARAVDLMYTACGGTSVYARSPLQRHMRDVHTATQHLMVAQPIWELAGRVLAGVESDMSGL